MINDYEYFKREVYNITQIDLNLYKEKQMKRRIDTLILRHHLDGYESFVRLIKNDPDILEEFVNYLTINVSEFYRNPDQWRILDDEVIPTLMTRFENIKIWSAACSTGDEPYTLAMVFAKHLSKSKFSIYATDLDKQVIKEAQLGEYSEKSLAGLPKEYFNAYFTKNADSNYTVDVSLKKLIKYERHNLLKDPFPKNLSLIVCRNVLIYFTEEAKDKIFEQFYESLAPGGILFLGATEQMMNYKQIGFIRKASFFFEKPL